MFNIIDKINFKFSVDGCFGFVEWSKNDGTEDSGMKGLSTLVIGNFG